MTKGFLILDFGSQYTQLIARRLRELSVYCEVVAFDEPLASIKNKSPYGIILSGGPSSVADVDSPKRDLKELLDIDPLLGICYGMQLMAHQLGGHVKQSGGREYGLNTVEWKESEIPVPKRQQVWMSHGDVVEKPPKDCEILARSEQGHSACFLGAKMLAFQFHPEVAHTQNGLDLLKYFIFQICHAETSWKPKAILEQLLDEIKDSVGNSGKVLCALSGGVDSTVVATLLTRALKKEQVHCVFVDTGLLRKNEYESVSQLYKDLGLNIHGVRAGDLFLNLLKGVQDPELKRKIIGKTFIDVFKSKIKEFESESREENGEIKWLAQGTLYPDIIESISLRGTNVTIKSHHNVGGLPKDLGLKLVEPLKWLFKDEVRSLGRELGIPEAA
jgi:GMP synthase (glutamine-hydrolysing)